MIHLDCYCDSSVDADRQIVCSAFVAIKNKEVVHKSSIVFKGRCNNNGELIAILKAIEWVESLPDLPSHHSVYIKTDSEEAIHSILYPKQTASLTIKSKRSSLASRLVDLKIIRVQRSQVQKAHCLAREGLKREIERLTGGVSTIDRQRQIDKRIERQWILSRWLETCK